MTTSVRLFASTLFGLVAFATAQGPTLYIDPAAGVDNPTGGGPTNPLRTITFASSLVGPAGPGTFRLRPGSYDASAETFPLALPDMCVVEADPARIRDAQAIVISGPPTGPGHTPAVQVGGRGAGPVDVTLRNLTIEGGAYIAVQIDGPAGTGALNFLAEGCVMNHYRDLSVLTRGDTFAAVKADRCTMRGLDKQVEVTARGTSTVVLGIDRGLLTGAWIGADLIANGGTILAQLRGVRIVDEGLQGVRMGTLNNGFVGVRAEHCLLRKNGRRTVNLPTTHLGGLCEDPNSLVGMRVAQVENSIFSGNVNDCPHYTPGNYTFGVNLVAQANLIGVGGNFTGNALFVEAGANDSHLLPGSAAIDVGDPAATTLLQDFEGDPRPNGAPDLGPDEHHQLYLYAKGAAHVGGPTPEALTFRCMAPGGTAFGGFLGLGHNGTPWGPGRLYLTPPIYNLFVGLTTSTGFGEVRILMPVVPNLIGRETWWQGGFATPPYLGINAHRVMLRE